MVGATLTSHQRRLHIFAFVFGIAAHQQKILTRQSHRFGQICEFIFVYNFLLIKFK